jgi:hypothetical protein
MAETYDDEIIDLTDLMEEGEPAKKQSRSEETAKEKPAQREPESFDLGKEISLDDEIVLDADEAPAPEVETAPEKPFEEALPEEPSDELPAMEPPQEREDFDAVVKEPAGPDDTLPDFSAPDEVSFEEPRPQDQRPSPTKTRTPQSVSTVFDAFFKETIEEVKIETGLGASEPIPVRTKIEPVEGLEQILPFTPEAPAPTIEAAEPQVFEEPFEAEAQVKEESPAPPTMEPPQEMSAALKQEMEAKVQAAANELKADVPALLESIVRPVMDDLIREITQTTRDILPGIVEKIIREEIEKLKKLD